MERKQAVVLIGGHAKRLKSLVNVPVSKAFLELQGQPILYWNLICLHLSGITDLIIVGHNTKQLYLAHQVLRGLSLKFVKVTYFQDLANGAHGIPYELRYLLKQTFLFDCGHSISPPEHYGRLFDLKSNNNVVFSSYPLNHSNVRQPVRLKHNLVYTNGPATGAIAHPIMADKQYATTLINHRFDIKSIIPIFANASMLAHCKNPLPPEFDVEQEMVTAFKEYKRYICKNLLPYSK